MAKLKKRRNQRRHDPIGRKDKIANKANGEALISSNSQITSLIHKLSSPSANDRSMAIGAITILCEDQTLRKLFLKEKLISIIIEKCLNDNNDEIMVESYGLLRNLAIDEGYDVIKYYWRLNIWQYIEVSMTKITSSFQYLQSNPDLTALSKKQQKDEKSKQTILYDFTELVISLVVVISGGSIDLFNEVFDRIDPVLTLVVDLIKFHISSENGKLSPRLFNTLLDFIYEFGNESSEFVVCLNSKLLRLDQIEEFIANSNNILTRTYLQGIKFHVNEVLNPDTNKCELSFNILSQLFDDLKNITLEDLKPIPPSHETSDINQNLGSDQRKQIVQMNLQSLEISIDLTTSIWEYLADGHSLPPQLINLMFQNVVPSIIDLIRFNYDNNDVLSLGDKLLVCLNNFAWLINSLDNFPVEWFDTSLTILHFTKTIMGNLGDYSHDLDHVDELVPKFNLLWAISKSLGPQIKPEIELSLLEGCVNLGKACLESIENGQVIHVDRLIPIIGFLASMAIIIDNVDITLSISEFIMQTINALSRTNHQDLSVIEVIIEAINAIFDIFGDEYEYDYAIFVKLEYLARLTQIHADFKLMYKKIDKNKTLELKLKAEGILNNLGRFIDYKQKEQMSG